MKKIFPLFFIFFFIFHKPLISQDIKSIAEIKKLNQKYYHIQKLESEKKFNISFRRYKDFIAQNHDFYKVYLVFPRCAKRIGKLKSAVDFFKRLLKKEPDNAYFYYGLGLCYEKQKDYSQASIYYEKAIGQQAKFLAPYFRRIYICTQKNISELINCFNQKIKINPDNSNLYYALGTIYQYRLRKYDQALKYFNAAIKIAQRVGDRSGEGKHLNTIGNCYWSMSDYVKALEYYEKAARIMHQIGDKTEEANYLGNCGLIYWNLGYLNKAMKYYQKVLVISKELGDIISEASTLRNIGYVHSRLNQYSRALECYNQALNIARSYSNRALEVGYLADIANIHWMMGNYQRALINNKKALKLFLDVENKSDLATRYNESKALKGIGHIYWKIGDYAQALEYYLRALDVNRRSVNREKEAQILVDIGNIYNNLGNYQKALEYLNEALNIQKEIQVKSAEGLTLANIGSVYLNQNKVKQSQRYFQKALNIAREIGNKRAESNRLVGIATVFLNQGEYKKALDIMNQSQVLAKETDNKDLQAHILYKKGDLYNELNIFSKSMKCYSQALILGENLKSANSLWNTYSGLGLLNEKQGRYQNALNHYQKSIEVIEKMRSQLQIKEFKSGFLGNKIKVYEATINLLVKMHGVQPEAGFGKMSFYFLEKAKARAFLDSLKESMTSINRNLLPELREQEHKITQSISTIQTQLTKPGLSDSARKDLLNKLKTEEEHHQHLILMIRNNNPEYANLVYPEPIKLDVIQKKLLNKKSAILEYIIGEENSFLFFITRHNLSIYRLSAGNIIQEQVENYVDLLSKTNVKKFRAFAAGKKLFQELIGPVEEKLFNLEKIIVIPDGLLHYLPFEALVIPASSSGKKFLVEDFQISYAPSASSLMNLKKRKKNANPKMDFLAFANPLYTFKKDLAKEKKADWIFREFCLEQGFNLSPLPYSGEEVKKIARLIKKGRRKIYTGRNASEENLKKVSLANFKIIHFATHGLFDEKTPLRSCVVLSLDEDPREDGFFQIREIYSSKLASELVVLSACQTGKGKLERGEGVSGLSRAFLFAGAKSVLVSLWNINDKITSDFMEYLYKYLMTGISKEEALQKAKIKMIGSKYNHPFYWAGFLLVGDGDSSVNIINPPF